MTELEALCSACGLCCDGSLFGRVDLDGDELEGARRHHLSVVASGRSFEQPCACFTQERTCAIYSERPRACRRFVCRLYEKHRTEGGPLEARLVIVRRARALLESEAYEELGPLLEESFARATG